MPEVIETIVYTFDELSRAAREAARDWYRQLGAHHGWWQSVYEDFTMICNCLGIAPKTRSVNLHGGGTMTEPCIWFSGFCNLGDGACFEGTWRYRRGGNLAIRAHAPQDEALHEIADRLQEVQQRNFYQLVADIGHEGRYCHEYAMVITAERDNTHSQPPTDDAEDAVTFAMRDLARWLYQQLQAEYEHITSDTEIAAAIIANEYTLAVSGRRFG